MVIFGHNKKLTICDTPLNVNYFSYTISKTYINHEGIEMSFATRYGFAEIKAVQLIGMDEDLRHSLWNELEDVFNDIEKLSDEYYSQQGAFSKVAEVIWRDFFKQPAHVMHRTIRPIHKKEIIRDKYYQLPWYEVYSCIEFTARLLGAFGDKQRIKFVESCNYVLDRENSAYRFINDVLAPITSELEIKNIEESLADEDEAAIHISSALTMLANKKNDQSRESIAQSISAVEAILKKVTGKKNASLSDLYNHSKVIPNHQQARQALLNLYNYTSSKEGIRHALTDESQPINPAWARFMLVICSAFVNLTKAESMSNQAT